MTTPTIRQRDKDGILRETDIPAIPRRERDAPPPLDPPHPGRQIGHEPDHSPREPGETYRPEDE
jgi:hypothetical protein